jgi:hypothetical protein
VDENQTVVLLNYFKINATTTTSEAGARSSTRNRDSCFVRDQKEREREREREKPTSSYANCMIFTVDAGGTSILSCQSISFSLHVPFIVSLRCRRLIGG